MPDARLDGVLACHIRAERLGISRNTLCNSVGDFGRFGSRNSLKYIIKGTQGRTGAKCSLVIDLQVFFCFLNQKCVPALLINRKRQAEAVRLPSRSLNQFCFTSQSADRDDPRSGQSRTRATMQKRNNWIDTYGGPHVLVPEELCSQWRGIEG
jgi:hypothetical protein